MASLLGFSAGGAVVVLSFVVIVESFIVSFVVCASPGPAESSAARVPTSRAVVFFIARASSDRLEQRARPRALVHESPAERTAYSSFEMKNCNGYATALSCEAAIIMWTQPWGNAPIRWEGFSRRLSRGVTLTRYATSSQKVGDAVSAYQFPMEDGGPSSSRSTITQSRHSPSSLPWRRYTPTT